jgi:hypothetical protein
MVTKVRVIGLTAAFAIMAAVGGYAAYLAAQGNSVQRVGASHPPIWTEIKWPFALDPWGTGLAFRCRAADCGSEVNLYLRAKIGFCDCVSTIDDSMVDRVGDIDLFARENSALGPGHAIDVRSMKGRSRLYTVGGGGAAAKSALSIALHERCDLIVATAAIGGGQPSAQEAAVLEFLKSEVFQRWAEVTLGL